MKEEKKFAVVGRSTFVVGVDIAKKKHAAVILDPNGQVIERPFWFHNSIDGFERLEEAKIATRLG